MPNDAGSEENRERRQRLSITSLMLGTRIDPLQRAFHEHLLKRRVQLLAGVLAALMLAWIPIDFIGLPTQDFPTLLLARLALVGLLLTVAWSLRLARRPGWTMAALAAVVLGQCLAFCAMQSALSPDALTLLRLGYGLFPFVLLAQLALFPLPVLHSLLLGLAVIASRSTAMLLLDGNAELEFFGSLWLMALLLAISVWAASTQFSLLLNLIVARRDAAHDALTGLANRRAALDRLASEVARARRLHQPLSLMMLDLDHFKVVNDTWGHSLGDLVLIEAARILREELRGEDLGVRYGGEEFLAILPGTDSSAAQHVAERIRRRTAAASIPADEGGPIRVTISIGVAALTPNDSVDTLIARADAALYQAKDQGRNQVALASIRGSAARPDAAAAMAEPPAP